MSDLVLKNLAWHVGLSLEAFEPQALLSPLAVLLKRNTVQLLGEAIPNSKIPL